MWSMVHSRSLVMHSFSSFRRKPRVQLEAVNVHRVDYDRKLLGREGGGGGGGVREAEAERTRTLKL